MRKDKDWLIICLADLRMREGKEYSPYPLFIGVVIISSSTMCIRGETGLKKNKLANFNFGKYSMNYEREKNIVRILSLLAWS